MHQQYLYYHYGFDLSGHLAHSDNPLMEMRVDSDWALYLTHPKTIAKNTEQFALLEALLMRLGEVYLETHPHKRLRSDTSLHIVRVIKTAGNYHLYYADITIGYGNLYPMQAILISAQELRVAERTQIRFVKSTPYLQRRVGSLPTTADPHDIHLVSVLTEEVNKAIAEALYPKEQQHIHLLKKQVHVELSSIQKEMKNVEKNFLVVTAMAEQFGYSPSSPQEVQKVFVALRHLYLTVRNKLDDILNVPHVVDLKMVEKTLSANQVKHAAEVKAAHQALNLAVERFYLLATPAIEQKHKLDQLMHELIINLRRALLFSPEFWERRAASSPHLCVVFGNEYFYPERLAYLVNRLLDANLRLLQDEPYAYLCEVMPKDFIRRTSEGLHEHVKAVDKLEKILQDLYVWLHKGPRELARLQALTNALQGFVALHEADFEKLQIPSWSLPVFEQLVHQHQFKPAK